MAVNADMVNQASGATMMKRAVELDTEGRYTEALVFYQSGIQQLMEVLRGIKEDAKRQHYRQKISDYMDRAEKLKDHIDKEKDAGKYHEQIRIETNSIGHSYETIFGRFIDSSLTEVIVEDPYIRSTHQVDNFLRFCELLVSSECAKIRKIHLVTSADNNNQQSQREKLTELQQSLQKHGVEVNIEFSDTLHDREIKFNNGWIIKIGRGLDIYQPAPGRFSIGYHDYKMRPCRETTVDVIHSKHTMHK